MTLNKEEMKDRFGLKHLTTNQEVAVSFTLFTVGFVYLVSVTYPLIQQHILPSMVGIVSITVGYLFLMESVRELEEKDHFLSRKLEDSSEN
ncbi:hypothetical protein [Candidatus Nanohalococcus occultus]|uniref:YrhC-like protein n=1 Tax=Candidatus Nanohalococcus occultus TaxID=2978047 RepID=A0ABY8CEY5_9ARCH|nr:hypothetical protein SVXNc_0740 [Candidatus Nanohaloarchaeota archaeon SVXNc]